MTKIHSFVVLALGLLTSPLLAAEEAAHLTSSAGPLGALAVGFGIAIAVLGAAFSQSRIASAYLEGVSRNPGAEKSMKTPLILSLIFVETLVLFTVLISFMIIQKV